MGNLRVGNALFFPSLAQLQKPTTTKVTKTLKNEQIEVFKAKVLGFILLSL